MTDSAAIVSQARLDQLFLEAIAVRQRLPNEPITAEVLKATPEEFEEFLHYLKNTEKVYTEFGLG